MYQINSAFLEAPAEAPPEAPEAPPAALAVTTAAPVTTTAAAALNKTLPGNSVLVILEKSMIFEYGF